MSLPTLDRRSVVPLYHQIQQHLLEQIRSGVIKPGEPVPSEQEISTRLRISRMTARQALKSLCDLGIRDRRLADWRNNSLDLRLRSQCLRGVRLANELG
jgi:DNA-binding GntR family transcriptional regulator